MADEKPSSIKPPPPPVSKYPIPSTNLSTDLNKINDSHSVATAASSTPKKEVAPSPIPSSVKRKAETREILNAQNVQMSSKSLNPLKSYILEVFPVVTAEFFSKDVSPDPCMINLATPDLTVREIKDMIIETLNLNPDYEDIELLVKDFLLSDHWKGTDIGLRPGTTRLHMKKKKRFPVRSKSEDSFVSAASTTPRIKTPSAQKKQANSHLKKNNEIEDYIQELEEENRKLKSEVDHLNKEYDLLAARLLTVSRERDRLEYERNDLMQAAENRRDQTQQFLTEPEEYVEQAPDSAFVDGAALNTSSYVHPTSVFCAVSLASMIIVENEEEEEFFDGEEPGPKLEDNTVSIEGHHFQFERVVSYGVSPEKVVTLIGDDVFDDFMEGEYQSIIVLGETFSGKSGFMEGFGGFGSFSNMKNTHNEVIESDHNESSKVVNHFGKRHGVCEIIAGRMFSAITAALVEAATTSSRSPSQYIVEVSGFQIFRDGAVTDFVSSSSKPVSIGSPLEFERIYSKMLKEKQVWKHLSESHQRGDPSSAESNVVITFELTKKDEPSFHSKLKIIETCGAELGFERDPIIGQVVEGNATVIALLHPSKSHNERSIEICTNSLEIVKRFEKKH